MEEEGQRENAFLRIKDLDVEKASRQSEVAAGEVERFLRWERTFGIS